MSSEQMAQFLNDVARGKLFSDEKIISKFRQGVKKFKLSKELMDRLKEEEQAIVKTSEERMIVNPKTNTEFRHYVKTEQGYIAINFKN